MQVKWSFSIFHQHRQMFWWEKKRMRCFITVHYTCYNIHGPRVFASAFMSKHKGQAGICNIWLIVRGISLQERWACQSDTLENSPSSGIKIFTALSNRSISYSHYHSMGPFISAHTHLTYFRNGHKWIENRETEARLCGYVLCLVLW